MKAASLSFTSRIRRSRGDCRSQLTLLLCLTAVLAAAAPAWWSQQGLLSPDVAKDDYTAVNAGQLKNTARKAAQAIESQHGVDSMGVELQAMITGWDAALSDSVTGDDLVAVNVGMLKNVAAPFYDRLRVLGNDPARFPYAYPWSVVRKSGGATTNGSDLLNVVSTSGLEAGMLVHGSGIPAGTTIAQFVNATQIRLSAPATQSGTGMVVAFARTGVGQRRGDVSLAVDSDVLTTSATAGLAVGMMVLGPGLPASARILSISSSGQIQLSQPSTVTLSAASCYFYPMDDHAMVNLGQLKNVFSFYAATLGDPVPLTFPISQSSNPAYYEAKQRWDALLAYASFLTESRPQGSTATDLDGDGIPNDQEYWMSLRPGGQPPSYFDADDIDGDRILDSLLINGLPLPHTEAYWNGTAPPTGDTVPVLNKRIPSDAVSDFFRFDYPSDGVMNYEEIKLGLSPLISSTLILADGRTRTDTANVQNDTKVLAWGLLHGSASLSPSVDAIADCWNKLIALGTSGRESWFAENGIVRQPGWLVTTDGTDAGSAPDGLDAFRQEAPVLLATRLNLPTNWTITDHDGDGMSDRWEYRYGLDPRSAKDKNLDPDNDGLTNVQEYNFGSSSSNPFLVDTDGDGYTDKGEKDAGTNATLTTAPSQMPLKMAKITSTLPSRFIGMPSDAMIVQVHKGGIPQPAVPITFEITNSVPSSWGLLASASGGVSTTGSLIVRTDSNGLASVTFTGGKTGSVQIRATAPSGITPSTQFFNVTIEAIPSYISSISGNYVNMGGGEVGEGFTAAQNTKEAKARFATAGSGTGLSLQIQRVSGLAAQKSGEDKFSGAEKVPFTSGKVASDTYDYFNQNLAHSMITLESPQTGPLKPGSSISQTFLLIKATGRDGPSYPAKLASGNVELTVDCLGSITFALENGVPSITSTDSVGWITAGTSTVTFTPPDADTGRDTPNHEPNEELDDLNYSVHLLPIDLATDLNNDGQITSADSSLREAAIKSGASDDAKEKGTEYLFINDKMSNGVWDADDDGVMSYSYGSGYSTMPKPPATQKDDDDAQALKVSVGGLNTGVVWFDHPTIDKLEFFKTKECKASDKLNMTSSSPFDLSTGTLSETIYMRLKDDWAGTDQEGDLRMFVGKTVNETWAELKLPLTVVRDFGAKHFFHAARDYILENNSRVCIRDHGYPFGPNSSQIFRLCVMREEATKMTAIDAKAGEQTGIEAAYYALPAVPRIPAVVINGNQCFFNAGWSEWNPLHYQHTVGQIADKCHGRVIRSSSIASISSDNFDDSTLPAEGSLLAGPDPIPVSTKAGDDGIAGTADDIPNPDAGSPGGKYIACNSGIWTFAAGRAGGLDALGGLSTNYDSKIREGSTFKVPSAHQMIGYAEGKQQGKGCIFTATQIKGGGYGTIVKGDASNSGVPALTPSTDAGAIKLFILDCGAGSLALMHIDPTGAMQNAFMGRKTKFGFPYYVNNYLALDPAPARP